MNRFAFILALSSSLACGSKSPSSPSPTPTTTTRIIALGGALDFGGIQVGQNFTANFDIKNQGTAPLTISSLNTPFAGVFAASFTNGSIPAGSQQTVQVRFAPTLAQNYSGTLTVNGDQTGGSNTLPINARGTLDGLPLFTRSGSGNTVFDMPTYVSRVRIRGVWNGRDTSNFIVRVGGSTVVNEILRNMPGQTYEGLHLVVGGVTQITDSAQIAWIFTEVR